MVVIEIDGSAGGGQLLRSALSLSAIAGEPVRIEGIRGNRPTPGLRPQHLTAVRLLSSICDAEVDDPEIGTDELTFRPGTVRAGEYEVDVGTAGSVTLLFDAVLPLAFVADDRIAVTATGGTDVAWSPPMLSYRWVKLPFLRSWGLTASVDLRRRGFYPEGGGEATLFVSPSTPDPLDLVDRGDLAGARVYSVESADLADRSVARRQATAAVERLEEAGIETFETATITAESASTGSALAVRLDFDSPDGIDALTGFDALGEPGKPAEDVGEEAAERAVEFVDSGAGAVDRHTADQLLLPLALAGGRLSVPGVTDHVETSLALLDAFGVDVEREGTVMSCDDGLVS
jgi:RNA 3'-terminal phosphate cyclase (ATP)